MLELEYEIDREAVEKKLDRTGDKYHDLLKLNYYYRYIVIWKELNNEDTSIMRYFKNLIIALIHSYDSTERDRAIKIINEMRRIKATVYDYHLCMYIQQNIDELKKLYDIKDEELVIKNEEK